MSRKSKALEFINDVYDIQVTGRHVLVTESMKDYAIEKISKIDRFSHRIIEVNVTMDIQKLDHRVDIVMKVDHIKIKSSASSTDMYASVDMAVDKLIEQFRKYKDRIQDHQARTVKSVDLNVNVLRGFRLIDEEVQTVNEDIEEENQKRLIESYQPHPPISKETRSLKTLRMDEALMKLDLSGDSFLIYRSEEDHKLKVIYRRKDNDFGVIEIE